MHPDADVNQLAFGLCAARSRVSHVKRRAATEREVVVEFRSFLDRFGIETRFS